jgi:hypothetical protein
METEVMTTDWIICPKHAKIKEHSTDFNCTQIHIPLNALTQRKGEQSISVLSLTKVLLRMNS